MKRILIPLLLSAAACLLLSACSGTDSGDATDPADTPAAESEAEAPTDPGTDSADTLPSTEPETAYVTEEETTVEEVTQPAAPDGIFDSVCHLDGFTAEKNSEFFACDGCSVVFNPDGTLTAVGTWKEGKNFAPGITLNYAKLAKACCTDYTDTEHLPNGGAEKYPVVVFTVRADKVIAGESNLFWTNGKRNSTQNTVIPVVDTAGEGTEYLVFDMTGSDFENDYPSKLRLNWAWGTGSAENLGASLTVVSINFYKTTEEAYADLGIDPQVPEDRSGSPLGISADKLDPLVENFFDGGTVRSETVMLLDPETPQSLLFEIGEVISVKSYDNKKTYTEGVDYAVRDGKLVALEGGSLPLITSERYYGADPDCGLMTEYNGKSCYTYWGEGQIMTDWQVNVTYTPANEWDGFKPTCEAGVYSGFFDKLKNGENVTIIFYGDSCTYGAASSFAYGYAPYQKSYAMLFTETLAALFDYTVHYVTLSLPDACYVPGDVSFGDKGTITFINPSVGGWTSADGMSNFNTHLKPFIEKYGCDLFVLDIGGNDGNNAPKNTRIHDEAIMDGVLALAPDTAAVIMSTMVCNPEATNGWKGLEHMQEAWLVNCADMYRRRGVACAACRFTSMHLSVLDHVRFRNVSGNNVNHPNDFLARVYAYTLIETVIGYENLD